MRRSVKSVPISDPVFLETLQKKESINFIHFLLAKTGNGKVAYSGLFKIVA